MSLYLRFTSHFCANCMVYCIYIIFILELYLDSYTFVHAIIELVSIKSMKCVSVVKLGMCLMTSLLLHRRQTKFLRLQQMNWKCRKRKLVYWGDLFNGFFHLHEWVGKVSYIYIMQISHECNLLAREYGMQRGIR